MRYNLKYEQTYLEIMKVPCVTQPCCNHFRAYIALSKHNSKMIRLCFLWFSLAQTLPDYRFLNCNASQFRYPTSEYVGPGALSLRKCPVLYALTTNLSPFVHSIVNALVTLNLLSRSVTFLKCTTEAAVMKRQDSLKLMFNFP